MPANERPEVIVTDCQPVDEPEVGVLRIGAPGRADVLLPEDVSARELRLACELLAQIVRLRRRQRAGDALRRRLAEQASTDPLTGLPNRRGWEQALDERLAALSPARRLCLAVLDLDLFKRINDEHGHAAGDEVLRATGRALRQSLREEDFVARLGGDEFGLLLLIPHEPAAASVIERARIALPVYFSQIGVHQTTASAGYHVYPSDNLTDHPPSAESVWAAADGAMREAKRRGRDQTVGA
jgi:diguanylate cyclase (GGDEF)-like protein